MSRRVFRVASQAASQAVNPPLPGCSSPGVPESTRFAGARSRDACRRCSPDRGALRCRSAGRGWRPEPARCVRSCLQTSRPCRPRTATHPAIAALLKNAPPARRPVQLLVIPLLVETAGALRWIACSSWTAAKRCKLPAEPVMCHPRAGAPDIERAGQARSASRGRK